MENTKAVIKRASITIEKNNVKKVQKTNIKFLIRAITIPIIILIIWQLAGVFGLVSKKNSFTNAARYIFSFQELIKTGEIIRSCKY